MKTDRFYIYQYQVAEFFRLSLMESLTVDWLKFFHPNDRESFSREWSDSLQEITVIQRSAG
jgi:hypothetical protein